MSGDDQVLADAVREALLKQACRRCGRVIGPATALLHGGRCVPCYVVTKHEMEMKADADRRNAARSE